jgi:serine/threonine protein kinase
MSVHAQSYRHHSHFIELRAMHCVSQTPPVLHRDIKPGNILLDQYSHGRLSDFGIACATRAPDTRTTTSYVRGSEFYICPMYRDMGTLSAATDLYSVGIVAEQLLSGSQNAQYLQARVRTAVEQAQLSSVLDTHCDWALNTAAVFAREALKCTSPQPQDRPTANSLSQTLYQLSSGSVDLFSNSTPLVASARECLICLTRPRAQVFRPCNHWVCCFECARLVCRSTQPQCPYCRRSITTTEASQGPATFVGPVHRAR